MENTILDQEEFDSGEPEQLTLASSSKRFGNYLLDVIGFYIVIIMLSILAGIFMPGAAESILEDVFSRYLVIYALYVLYYTLFEGALNGKTPAKFLTRTRALTEDGDPLSWQNAFTRSLCRLIPFEAFSFLGGSRGWHDSISHTVVVDEAW